MLFFILVMAVESLLTQAAPLRLIELFIDICLFRQMKSAFPESPKPSLLKYRDVVMRAVAMGTHTQLP